MRGVEVIAGARVLCARIGRQDWIIVGSIERSQSSTGLAGTDNIVAMPQNLTIKDKGSYASAEWDGSHFDIAVWQMQIAAASTTDDFSPTHYTDNTQYDIYTDQELPYTMYMRVRAVGPAWDYGSPTAWVEFTITERTYEYFTGLQDTPSTYVDSASTIPFVNSGEDALEFQLFEHDMLLNLEDDDHPQYLLTDGTRSVDGDFHVGEVVETIGGAGYGKKLYLSGGVSVDGTWDSDNSDPIWMARYNVANDETELHINVGDNGAAVDAVVIGYTESGIWYPIYRIETIKTAHIVDADGTLSDITTKFNVLLARLEAQGLLASS